MEKIKEKLNVKSVLDFGAGNCRDREFCLKNFSSYIPHDNSTKFKINQSRDVLEQPYDLVLFNYILNILIPEDRFKIIDEIKNYLGRGSIILLAVRTNDQLNEVKPSWIKYKDGWITSKNTFQHFFTNAEIYEIFNDNYLKIVDLKRGVYILYY